jgi:glycine/D-amino acid oxidase-like deaminating enzyme
LKLNDFAVIGAGIAGSSIAYELSKRGKKVVVYDDDSVFCASKAAGAFVSPMVGKPNPFKDLTNKAFFYSTNLYKELLGDKYLQCGVLRLPKNDTDKQKFNIYEKYIDFEFQKKDGGFFFPQAGIIRPHLILPRLLQNVEVIKKNITDLKQIKAKNIIIATGAKKLLFDLPYKIIRGVWGERITIKTSTILKHSYHKNVSVSPTIEDKILIGATHKREHSFSIDKDAQDELLQKANEIIDIKVEKILEIKAGMRSGSMDYFPILGQLIDVQKSIAQFPCIKKGTKIPQEKLFYHKNIFLHLGHGGRGFVLAPFSAKILADFITKNIPIDSKLQNSRFFYRWARKIDSKDLNGRV